MYHLVPDHDFSEFFDKVKDFRPDVVGLNVYTGNHVQAFEALKELKAKYPNIAIVVGGPHPTYFPEESSKYADYVVMSEGFHALRKILESNASPGIMHLEKSEVFPQPDRETFYAQYPEHAKSPIKSFITMTGCPFKCTYCYNSSEIEDIQAPPNVLDAIRKSNPAPTKFNRFSNRLFPHNIRSVDAVIEEASEVAEKWPTNVLYCQDDVHGFDVNEWLPELGKRWNDEVKIPYHAQMRWEMTSEKRLDILRDAGCFGLTLAIEAADFTIRREVLDRAMKEDIIFAGMQRAVDREFKIRTEQITGLPYGATSVPTPMNLDADLGLVELNVRLRKETGGPMMAWASTFAPYAGTKLGIYCRENGHFESVDDNDIKDSFFDRSVLRHPKEWVGPTLAEKKDDPDVWLSPEDQETYRDQNAALRMIFNFVASLPNGHKLAKSYIEKDEPHTFERLSDETIAHLIHEGADDLLWSIKNFETNDDRLRDLKGYFGALPKGKLAATRYLRYGAAKGFNSKTLSTATRHHFYDELLYNIESRERAHEPSERYVPKL
jgi:hypothetical protein